MCFSREVPDQARSWHIDKIKNKEKQEIGFKG